jgi:hypothetical protein
VRISAPKSSGSGSCPDWGLGMPDARTGPAHALSSLLLPKFRLTRCFPARLLPPFEVNGEHGHIRWRDAADAEGLDLGWGGEAGEFWFGFVAQAADGKYTFLWFSTEILASENQSQSGEPAKLQIIALCAFAFAIICIYIQMQSLSRYILTTYANIQTKINVDWPSKNLQKRQKRITSPGRMSAPATAARDESPARSHPPA